LASQVPVVSARPSPKAGLPSGLTPRNSVEGRLLRLIYNVQHFSVDVANWLTGQTTKAVS
jgi:hypothetical protein